VTRGDPNFVYKILHGNEWRAIHALHFCWGARVISLGDQVVRLSVATVAEAKSDVSDSEGSIPDQEGARAQ
jgi:hypothetical protein